MSIEELRAELDALKRDVRGRCRTFTRSARSTSNMAIISTCASTTRRSELFADDAEVLFLNGIYRGKDSVARIYKGWFRDMFTQGVNGPVYGFLLDHFISQDIVDISEDGTTAWGRFRALMQAGSHESKEPKVRPMPDQCWEAGIHENTYVKAGGLLEDQTAQLQYALAGRLRGRLGAQQRPPPAADQDISRGPARAG